MDKQIPSDLMVVAVELRLAAHDHAFISRRLTEQRLLELADMIEGAVLSLESNDLHQEVAALAALRRRTS